MTSMLTKDEFLMNWITGQPENTATFRPSPKPGTRSIDCYPHNQKVEQQSICYSSLMRKATFAYTLPCCEVPVFQL